MTVLLPVWAVVVAAGKGTRMGDGPPKVHRHVLGKQVLAWSCEAFLGHRRVSGVVLAHAADDQRVTGLPCFGHERLHLTHGADDRAASVRAGLAAARAAGAPDDALILVHDGARSCVSAAEIDALIDAATDAGDHGALLALPVTDTLKRRTGQQVKGTLDREGLARALTPQAFKLGLLDAALAAADSATTTDDASAMEQAGFHPQLVWWQVANLKVTYADDLALAAFWLQQQGRDA